MFSLAHPLLLALPAIFVLYRVTLRVLATRPPLPPGPRSNWLGRADLPKSYQWHTYAKWRKQYGDLIYIDVFRNPVLVLNSIEACNDLLEKRASNYSTRPHRTMVVDLMGFGWLFSTMPYGAKWRLHRARFHNYFPPNAATPYQAVETEEAHILLRNLLQTPDNFSRHVRRSAAAIVMSISYGHKIKPEGDPYVDLADKALNSLGEAGIFGTYMVDYLPILKYVPAWMPGAGFQIKAKNWNNQVMEMLNRPYEMVQQRMVKGTALPCIVSKEMENWTAKGSDPASEQTTKNVAAVVFAAGADTTVSAINSFILAMVLHPDVQKRAQADLDRVVGRSRLPLFSDRAALPYLEGVVWEALRWNPVTPLGIAHCVQEDDVYEGYLIPKGTTVLPNVWGVLHDEEKYPDPLRFDPARYMEDEAARVPGVNELPHPAFGFGRRVCPGRHLAQETIWITVASILSVFDIVPAKDESGQPIIPSPDYTSSLLSRPMDFVCQIVPRSQAAVDLIEQTAEDAATVGL